MGLYTDSVVYELVEMLFGNFIFFNKNIWMKINYMLWSIAPSHKKVLLRYNKINTKATYSIWALPEHITNTYVYIVVWNLSV